MFAHGSRMLVPPAQQLMAFCAIERCANVFDNDANDDGIDSLNILVYYVELCLAMLCWPTIHHLILKTKGNLNDFYFMPLQIDRNEERTCAHILDGCRFVAVESRRSTAFYISSVYSMDGWMNGTRMEYEERCR